MPRPTRLSPNGRCRGLRENFFEGLGGQEAAEFIEGAGLDLTNAFLRHAEVFAHLFEGLRTGLVAQAEAAHDDLTVVFRWPLLVRYSVYAAMLYLIVLFGDFAGAQFIYFQF